MISAHSIFKRFGSVCAVQGVSFELRPGQIAGLLGPNGAGKSTLIRMITGFLSPDRGTVSIGGHDTLQDPLQARRLIGYLPESCPIYPEMRGIDYLCYRARLHGLDRRSARRAAEQAAERCRLGTMSRKRVGTLSKGYRQRVGLASTLVHDPKVLILDEPTNGLDPSQIREARSLIRELAENRTMLISSHILPEIERTCDRVLVIVGGRICGDGPPERLIQTPGVRLRVECKVSASDAIWSSVRALPGVEHVRPLPSPADWTHAEIVLHDAGVRDTIAEMLAGRGVIVRSFAEQRVSLEDAFVQLTESAEARS
ncbi:MAG: ATP-binding cassette domain-containing protein [Phycisphaerales bacterium]